MQEIIDMAEASILHTYNRYPVVFGHGQGVYLYDTQGKEYLDFVAGIAVFALGYGDLEYNTAIKEQVDKLLHTSNYYYNQPTSEAAKRIVMAAGMSRVFFTNSGAEAIEGAIKAARKYAFLKDGRTDHEIIAMEHSFHGRTMGALSVTGTPKYREPFEPLIGHVQFAVMNDFDSVLSKVNDRTCAIILETVQGEGGIFPADHEFLKKVEAICKDKDILLILDEIQCGMGRCGSLFAWQQYGVQPDIMTLGKALGCGIPVGAFVLGEKVAMHSLVAGDHGTTYGGNPLAGVAMNKVLDLFEKKHIIENVQSVSLYLEERLNELVNKHDSIIMQRGLGLMRGLVFQEPVAPIINKALMEGLVLINAGTHVVRFVPPLTIEKEHVDKMISILDRCICETIN